MEDEDEYPYVVTVSSDSTLRLWDFDLSTEDPLAETQVILSRDCFSFTARSTVVQFALLPRLLAQVQARAKPKTQKMSPLNLHLPNLRHPNHRRRNRNNLRQAEGVRIEHRRSRQLRKQGPSQASRRRNHERDSVRTLRCPRPSHQKRSWKEFWKKSERMNFPEPFVLQRWQGMARSFASSKKIKIT